MVRIGMVGVGDISGIYLKNITETFREIELVAVCDLIRERAETARAAYNVPKLYDTMQERSPIRKSISCSISPGPMNILK